MAAAGESAARGGWLSMAAAGEGAARGGWLSMAAAGEGGRRSEGRIRNARQGVAGLTATQSEVDMLRAHAPIYIHVWHCIPSLVGALTPSPPHPPGTCDRRCCLRSSGAT